MVSSQTDDDEDNAEGEASGWRPIPGQKRKTANRILIAEDSDRIRIQYDFILSEAGFDVVSVATGEAAIQELQNSHFDVVVTDLEMEGLMMGVRIAAQRVTDYPRTKVIVVTGMVGISRAAVGRHGLPGADETLFKPVNAQTLVATVKKVLF